MCSRRGRLLATVAAVAVRVAAPADNDVSRFVKRSARRRFVSLPRGVPAKGANCLLVRAKQGKKPGGTRGGEVPPEPPLVQPRRAAPGTQDGRRAYVVAAAEVP